MCDNKKGIENYRKEKMEELIMKKILTLLLAIPILRKTKKEIHQAELLLSQ